MDIVRMKVNLESRYVDVLKNKKIDLGRWCYPYMHVPVEAVSDNGQPAKTEFLRSVRIIDGSDTFINVKKNPIRYVRKNDISVEAKLYAKFNEDINMYEIIIEISEAQLDSTPDYVLCNAFGERYKYTPTPEEAMIPLELYKRTITTTVKSEDYANNLCKIIFPHTLSENTEYHISFR